MKKICNTLFKIIITSIVIIIISFLILFINSRKAAMDYLQISTITDEESYQRVKKNIYKISSDEVREIVFSKEHYDGPSYNEIIYKINSAKCIKIKGFNHFIFAINFTVKDWRTIESLVYVQNGRIYNAHRRD